MVNNSIQIILDLKLCRICGVNEGVTYLFDDKPEIQPSAKIMYCTKQIEIFKGDGLSEHICVTCLGELNAAYDFVLKCEATHMKLHCLRTITLVEPQSDEPEVKIEDFNNIMDDDDRTDSLFEDICENNDLSIDSKLEIKLENKANSIDNDYQDNMTKDNTGGGNDIMLAEESLSMKDVKPKRPYKKRERILPTPQWHVCKVCNHKSKTKSILVAHMRTHSDERPFACKMCDKTYKDAGSLFKHKKMHHGDSNYGKKHKFICEHCGKVFHTKTHVIVHLRIHTGEKPYKCMICLKQFTQLGGYNQHKLTHMDRPKNHKCVTCGKGFVCQSLMKRHQIVHMKREQHLCNVCNKTFKALSSLQSHLSEQHNYPNSIVCSLCGHRFNTVSAFNGHMNRWHSERSGFCETCSKNVTNLQVHMRKHTGEKPLKCEYCDASFSDKRGLSRHTSHKHLFSDKFACSIEGCMKKFPTQPMLQFHIDKYHKKKVTIKCDLCSRGFYRKCDYVRHKMGTHNEKVH